MGPGRFELPIFAVSERCHNRLDHGPADPKQGEPLYKIVGGTGRVWLYRAMVKQIGDKRLPMSGRGLLSDESTIARPLEPALEM